MSNKAYVVINLATKKLSFMESGKELFNSRIETGEIPFNDYTLSALIQHVKLYYDGNYPSTLIFDFDNPFQLALSSIDPCIVNKNIHFIKIEKADELATALEIDKEEIIRSVCPEEATPYYEFNSRRVPVFIMNVQLDF